MRLPDRAGWPWFAIALFGPGWSLMWSQYYLSRLDEASPIQEGMIWAGVGAMFIGILISPLGMVMAWKTEEEPAFFGAGLRPADSPQSILDDERQTGGKVE